MRVGSGIKLAVLLLSALSFIFAPGLAPLPPDGPFGDQGVTVASAVGGYSSVYMVRNLSSTTANYLHEFVGTGTSTCTQSSPCPYSPASIASGGSSTYFLRSLPDSVVPSGLYTLTVSSDQDLEATFVGNESASGPTTGIVTPMGDASLVGVPTDFTAYYMDGLSTSTNQRLTAVYMMIGSSSSNSVWLLYNPVLNKVYVRNDAGSSWLGGYAPGSSNVIENSQAALLVEDTTATWISNNHLLRMKWSVRFKASYAGSRPVKTQAVDSSASTGWSSKGTWTVSPLAITPESVSPNSGTSGVNATRSFVTVYEDTNDGGAADIAGVALLASSSAPASSPATTANSFYGRYDRANNLLYLAANNGTDMLGGYTPGSSNTITNSYFSLDVANTSVISSGNNLTVTWAVRPLANTLNRTFGLYLAAQAVSGETGGWSSSLGTWLVSYGAFPVSVTPTSGTSSINRARTYTAVYRSRTTYADIDRAWLRASPGPSPYASLRNALQTFYDQSSDTFYLRNAANTAWLSGTSGVLSNGYFSLNINATTVVTSSNSMTIGWAITPLTPAAGKTYGMFLRASDSNGIATAWTSLRGTWNIVTNQAPTRGILTPSSGGSNINATRVFTTTFYDNDGVADVSYAYFLASPGRHTTSTFSYGNAFYAMYNEQTNKIFLRNRLNTAWLGPYTPGTSSVPNNGVFGLDLARTSVTKVGTRLTIVWGIRPLSATRNKTYYLYRSVRDTAGADTVLTRGYGGTWGAIRASGTAPSLGSLTPSSGGSDINDTRMLTTTFYDDDGVSDISNVYFLASPGRYGTSTFSFRDAFYATYNEQTNKFYMRNKYNSAWLGGYQAGTSREINNTFFSLDLARTTVTKVGTRLTIVWAIKPLSPTGNKTYYLYRRVRDTAGADTILTRGYGGTWGAISLAATSLKAPTDSPPSD